MLRSILVAGLLVLSSPLSATPVSEAKLLSARWLDNSAGLDISGLSFCDGKLLAVSDKDSGNLYQVDVADRGVSLVPDRALAGLAAPGGESAGLLASLIDLTRPDTAMDFEGVSCDGESVYLLSERHHRIANLDNRGTAEWLPQRWAEAARERGYLQKFNAAGEGLAKVGGDFWIALEREPRGLLHLKANASPALLEIPPVAGLDFRGRNEDITGLAFYHEALFTLERNAFAVCRRSLEDLRAEWCIDYGAIEEAPEFVYRETEYGKGEGLAVDDSGIYVVLDNNNVARVADPGDRRALLLHLQFPEAPAASDANQPGPR
ncbi:esterase-like activity of phytase family protein [Microbulbifer litoralis]|uniref:esterase-like activity of phytase family protein n=1 Tax=Microbulbifer litoralis TaxID=2933965 RepID=UPI0020279E1F|nr:esterase-like activity of phytase family protein [Microbulbifer sp. GX H0434]